MSNNDPADCLNAAWAASMVDLVHEDLLSGGREPGLEAICRFLPPTKGDTA